MYKTWIVAGAICCVSAAALRADFTYEQTTKITGGMMAGAMRIAGAFSKQAREPMVSTIMVKGDRMATVSNSRINIVDLRAETFTDVDLEKKTYSVMTFAEMAKAMEAMTQKMGQQPKQQSDAQMSFKADVKQTGETRNILGLTAKQTILTVDIQATDKKSGNEGGMSMVNELWLAPSVPGYEEVKNFHMRMAQKMAFGAGMANMAGMLAAQPGAAKGMAELAKEASKLEGVPLLTIMRMSPKLTPEQQAQMEKAQADAAAAQAQQGPPPSAGDAAAEAAGSAAGSRLGGRFGGLAGGALGGLGRRRKPAEDQAQAQTQPPAPVTKGGSTTPAGTMMETTTETTSFSASADASKLEVPAGFKQVESEMLKAMKR